MVEKGHLVYATAEPIRGAGWPGLEVLGVVYAIAKEGIWVKWPGSTICLHRFVDLTSID